MEAEESEILAACRNYLGFVVAPERAGETSKERNQALARHLDRLACAIHLIAAPAPSDSDAPDASPDVSYPEISDIISVNFPDLGWYPVVSELDVKTPASVLTGDAIDDIADIYRDLSSFIWHYENASKRWAFYELKDMYRIHWGKHLRDLQSYIHFVLYDVG